MGEGGKKGGKGRTDNFNGFAVSCGAGLCYDDVVDGLVFLAEAREADADYHSRGKGKI